MQRTVFCMGDAGHLYTRALAGGTKSWLVSLQHTGVLYRLHSLAREAAQATRAAIVVLYPRLQIRVRLRAAVRLLPSYCSAPDQHAILRPIFPRPSVP